MDPKLWTPQSCTKVHNIARYQPMAGCSYLRSSFWKSLTKAMATLGMDSRSAAGELKDFGRFRKRVLRYRVCMYTLYRQDKSLVGGHYIFSVHTRERAGRSSAEAAKDV